MDSIRRTTGFKELKIGLLFIMFADAINLAFLARVDSTMYSKMALWRKHLASEDTRNPKRARFAGSLLLDNAKPIRVNGIWRNATSASSSTGVSRVGKERKMKMLVKRPNGAVFAVLQEEVVPNGNFLKGEDPLGDGVGVE